MDLIPLTSFDLTTTAIQFKYAEKLGLVIRGMYHMQ